jgi:hypothetical protein
MCFSIPFSNLAMAGGDTEAGKKRKELAQIMTSRQVPNPLDVSLFVDLPPGTT